MGLYSYISSIPMFVCAFWAVALFAERKTNTKAKRFLGYYMCLAFVLFFSYFIFFQKHYNLFLFLDSIYIFCSLSMLPLYYLYLRLLTVDADCNIRKTWVILPSFLVALVVAVFYFLMTPEEKDAYIRLILYEEKAHFDFSFLGRMQILLYKFKVLLFAFQSIPVLVFGSELIINYNQKISNYFTNIEEKGIYWEKIFLYLFVLITFFGVFLNYAGKASFGDNYLLIFFSFIFSATFYIIGYFGFRQSYSIEQLEAEVQLSGENINFYSNVSTTYAEEFKDNLRQKLIFLLEKEEVFKNPDLRITDLASLLNTNRTYVSQIINNEFGCPFSDFINKYRIEYAKKMMKSTFSYQNNLQYFAEESGFASLNSFLRAFKKEEGVTPGKYRSLWMKENHFKEKT